MATNTIWENFSATPSTSTGTVLVTDGVRFIPATAGQVAALRWYRHRTGGSTGPASLALWQASTQAQLASVTAPDNGAVGWQTFNFDTPIAVSAGVEYRVSGNFAIGVERVGLVPGPLAGAPSAFTIPNPSRAAVGGSWGYPSTTNNDFVPMVDVILSPTGAGPAPIPPDEAGVQNALARWLSTTDGTQADSAPLLDHTTLATVNTNTAAVKADADDWAFGLGAAAHGYYADIKTLIGNIKTITDTLPTPIAQLTSIVLDHYSADIDQILAQIDGVLSNLGAQSTDLSGTAGSAVGALSGRTGFPATGWSMSAEADFEDAIAFAEPADAYVLSITSYQDTQPANESPAGLWLPRLGWWCVLNGSLASQRQFVDFQQMLLDDQGRRMPGCAIQLRPGTLATVQAWLLA
jgi:hypothetical protein